MSRPYALELAERFFDEGRLQAALARRVAMPTESQAPERAAMLHAYLADEIAPALQAMGFACTRLPNPVEGAPPFLIAHRAEPGRRAHA